ncbi:MAG: hypothetical protein ACJAU0_002348 [Flavobacteriales bacterium]|jgi:uncharacterized protein YijF (DUF1287 family)
MGSIMIKPFLFLSFLFCLSIGYAQVGALDIADAALVIVDDRVIYDPSYFSMAYPNGDVPSDRGVCTDVVIRTYRVLGIDLQRFVHEDMNSNFAVYPQRWGLKGPDKNIDHRRVPNLMTFFERKGKVLPNEGLFGPGEIVCWDLGGGILHIGMISSSRGTSGNYLVVHNIGGGQVLEDVLFRFELIGHYLYLGDS